MCQRFYVSLVVAIATGGGSGGVGGGFGPCVHGGGGV